MLSESIIKNEASSSAVYYRGIRYYNEDRITKLSFDKTYRCFNATVAGEVYYEVTVHFDENLLVDDYDCNCPAYYKYEGACKHIIALMKVIQAQWNIYFLPSNRVVFSSSKRSRPGSLNLQSDDLSTKLMNLFEQDLAVAYDLSEKKPEEVNTMIIPTFCLSAIGSRKEYSLEFHIGNIRLYVVKDIPDLLTAYLNKRDLYFGKKYTFRPREAVFDETSAALLQIIIDAHSDEKYLQGWSTYGYTPGLTFSNKKSMRLTNSMLLRFLEIMEDKTFDAYINNQQINGISIHEGRPPFPLNLRSVLGGIKLSLESQSPVYYGLDADNRYIYHQGLIYHVDRLFAQTITPLIAAFAQNPRPELAIGDNDVARFFSTVRPALESVTDIDVEPALFQKYCFEEPERKVYFDRFQNGIAARIEIQYSTYCLNPALQENIEAIKNADGKVLLRSIKKEKQLVNIFRQYQFQLLEGSFVQEEEELVFKFLQDGLPELETLAEIFYSNDFKARINYNAGVFPGVRINTGNGFLELSLEYRDISPREFIELLKSYKMKKNYCRLKNGSFLALDNSQLQGVVELMAELDVRSHEIAAGKIELPCYRAPYLDQVARERGLNVKGDGAFKALVREIREPRESDYELPSCLQTKLRHYQEKGFKWLKSLSAYRFGGILADDMGLGKTLQVLSLLLSEKAQGGLTSLAIVPTSLMYHWQDEARRFTPDLEVVVISGSQQERREIIRSLDTPDLIVTSYALIKRDLVIYRDMQFRYCILDEAQNIKNPNTQVAKTVKQIRASARFALTGTPIENSLTELWSIFDFLMPGYLLSHNKFRSRYEVPIVKNNQPEVLQELKRHIQPFVMRRMKREVLKELPKKTENKMSNSMTAEQRKLYLAYLLQAQNEFQQEVQKHGFDRSQIKILSILTRLRQICCHPSLFIENYSGGSGKLELLMEVLGDAIESGHRILVFSQFTSMLSLIKTELQRSSISYYYLDGSTPAEQRMKLVHSFNAGQQKVFLISLKAGGTGLNLTGADVVIHYDPWWNPAVEDQATDRAYRIGQKNAVQVIKLISKDSVEEKIFILQEKKRALINAVIQPGENFLSKMSEEDIRMLFEV